MSENGQSLLLQAGKISPSGSVETSFEPTVARGMEAFKCLTGTTQVAVLTGGWDRPYALGLASSLIAQGVKFDFIGSNEVDGRELHQSALVRFLNLRGDQDTGAPFARKIWRVMVYYARLLGYAAVSQPSVFHILWNNKFEQIDRTFILLYYRVL